MSCVFSIHSAVILLAIAVSCCLAVDMPETPTDAVHVCDFGALPDDHADDTQAINQAIAHLKATGKRHLVFDAGRYDLSEVGLKLIDLDDLIVEGQVDAQGKPATQLVRNNDFYAKNAKIGYLLETRNCNRLALRNLLFDNDPQYTTAGQVVSVTDDAVTVKIFDGLPRIDGVGAYCMNAWDMTTRRLKHQPSLTFGHDVTNNRDELSWHTMGEDTGRLMRINSATIASQVKLGDGLSWHAGFWGYQLLMTECDDLTLSNLWTVNAAGFAMCAQRCHNITADRVVVRSEGTQLAVGPRDGWKLYACTGKVIITDMFIEGVRWDGQNVHGSFLQVDEKMAQNRLICTKQWSTTKPIAVGSVLSFWDDATTVDCKVAVCNAVPIGNTGRFDITLDQDIPAFVTKGTMVTVWDWDIAHYELKNATFQRIAGSASILRNSHALFEDCTFDNIMYPALFIGASINEGEGMYPQNVTVRNTTFIDSGWVERQGIKGMIAANTQGTDLPVMGRIRIEGCTFQDAPIGINVFGTKQVDMLNNHFDHVDTPYQFDKATVTSIQIKD